MQSIVKGKLGETLTAQMAPLQARELKPSTAITTVTTIITGQIGEKEPAISLVAQTGSYINGNLHKFRLFRFLCINLQSEM